ncbi:MAG: glutamate--tRNA ligase, partial [Armatimonadota bacterium]
MKITHVLRADEFISSTPRHIQVYKHLGLPLPEFAHLPMILGPDRSKLGKRHGATSVKAYREQGYLPEAMVNFLALLGWSAGENREIYSVEELIAKFSLEGVNKNPAVFDIQKLEWMNGEYIRMLTPDDLAERVIPFLRGAGLVGEELSSHQKKYIARVMALEQERMKKLSEAPALVDFFLRDEIEYDPKAVSRWLSGDGTGDLLRAVAHALQSLDRWAVDAIEAVVRSVGDEMGRPGGKVIHPVRSAVTGRTVGPGLFETMEVLGRERCVARLKSAASKFCGKDAGNG